jgi:hypothetical protein
VAKAMFDQWFCKFGIPAQIHTDGGKEFVNKLLTDYLPPTVQITVGSVQQNGKKIVGFIC